MYLYKAFGLCVQSDVLLPQFLATEDLQVDVTIRLGRVEDFAPVEGEREQVLRINDAKTIFFWDQVGTFSVRNGNEILVEPWPDVEERLLRLPLLGTAFAGLLQQRGLLVLHASAIGLGEEAVVFLGWKGSGKSTTAAMLYGRGHRMLSDDIVALDLTDATSPRVLPGYPSFKLMPETAALTLGDNPEDLPKLCEGFEKRFRPSLDGFSRMPISLKAIYALEDGLEIQAILLKPQEAVTALIANTYSSRYGKQLLQNKEAILNLRQCSNLVNSIPIYRLQRPRSLQLLGELTKLIETHRTTSSPEDMPRLLRKSDTVPSFA